MHCFELVRRATGPSAPQVLRLLDYVVFNALIGNLDAHAKNFSLLYRGKAPVLAPLYDVLSTAVYPDLTPKMTMKLGSKYQFGEVQARHWDRFAEAAGLAKAQTRSGTGEAAARYRPKTPGCTGICRSRHRREDHSPDRTTRRTDRTPTDRTYGRRLMLLLFSTLFTSPTRLCRVRCLTWQYSAFVGENEGLAQAHQEIIHGWRRHQRQQHGHRQCAHYGGGQRLQHIRSGTDAESQRQQP